MSQSLLQLIQKTIPTDCWPARGERLVIGISGGPDSTALAFLLDELNSTRDRGWRLHLAHLNHGLRGTDSDSDARFVADLAAPGTAEFAALIAPHARTRRCALLKNHGAVSWDRDLDRARSWMEILEAYCRTIIMAKQLGGMSPLPGAAIARLRKLGRDL